MLSYRSATVALLIGLALLGCKEEAARTYDDIEAQKEAYTARIAALDDPAARETLQNAAYEVAYLQEVLLPVERTFEAIVYETDPFAWMTDYPSVDDMVSQYIAGLFPFTSPDTFRGDIDVHQSFTYPFKRQLVWADIALADGSVSTVNNDPFAQTDDGFEARSFGRSLNMIAEGPDVPLPVQMTGQIEMTVPTDMTRMTFVPDDLGKARTVDGYSVTMTSLTPTSVDFEIKDTARRSERHPFIIAATDATGQFLNSNSSSVGPTAEYATATKTTFDAILASAEADGLSRDEILARFRTDFAVSNETFGSDFTAKSNFEGVIETVEVLITTGSETRTAPLDLAVREKISRVKDAANYEPVDLATDGIAYAHELEHLTASDLVNEIAPNALDDAITPLSSIFWDGQEMVKFYYPPNIASTLFTDMAGRFDNDTAKVSFLDGRGNPVDPQPTFALHSGRLEFEVDPQATRPQSVSGTVDVNLMADLDIQTFTADALPDGVTISGNQLHLPPSDARFFAIDGAGRFLRKFHRVAVSQDWDRVQTVDYYYGKPAGVVMVSPGAFAAHNYRFAVDLVAPQDE